MSVSVRNMVFAGAGLAVLALAGMASAGGGKDYGGGKDHGGGYGGGYDKGGSACCGDKPKGHGVIVPGVNVAGPNVVVNGPNVNVRQGAIINTQTNLNVYAAASASASSEVVIAGGGGGYFGGGGVNPTAIGGLNVVGGEERYTETVTEQVPVTEEYCVDQISYASAMRAVQAVCLDDTGTPHPASQVESAERIAAGYSGEVFRCMAGTSMQVTLGKVSSGNASFAHGESFACKKGEALVHKPGGELTCAPQTPQRNCNERSLLRRYGPGIKLVEARVAKKVCVPQTRTRMETVSRQVERVKENKPQSVVFDGGVGQGVY